MEGDFEAGLRSGDVTFGADDATLLRAIDDAGSLNRAADDLGRSYARALARLQSLEGAFGSLVERTRGGSGGGGSQLTPQARDLLARLQRLSAEFAGVAEADETVLDGRVVDRDGELGTVETAVGRLRALVPAEATDVQVWLRADAVTLHEPADAPAAGGTSARNRFEGTVSEVDAGQAIATVTVDVGAESPLSALVTMDSVARLGLEPGRQVVVTAKATATRAVAAPAADSGPGVVERAVDE
ncbi:TOBE domain-containing protein [Haloarchaeobius sp. HME9146]|uniref:TOBE domain-containing protein n=1 Tax=Haloarchaeobius sp. HME9146 TaxID=2978732 RepID=UPI0021BE80B9|nr:TOBE domain-containing protein [Haloarchaeobius sp. HME9146]MCT9094470.1 TOBE domain-containing protein [Haloarchaeobius sp. HME9146]